MSENTGVQLRVAGRTDRAKALTHPLRRRALSELQAHPYPLSLSHLADSVQKPQAVVRYHLRILEQVGWLELDGGQPLRAGLRDEVREELPSAFARAALGKGPD